MNNILNTNNINNVLEGKQMLYHGTNRDIKRIEFKKCRKYTDFGRGFYLTSNRKQAEKWAIKQYKKFINAQQSDYIKENSISVRAPIIIPYRMDKNKSNKYVNKLSIVGEIPVNGDINVKIFQKPSSEWAQFVLNNRTYSFTNFSSLKYNGDGKYDIVIGPVADGMNRNIADVLQEYNNIRQSKKRELYDDELQDLAEELTYKKYNNVVNDQYSFHTNDALKMLTKFEPIYLKNVSKICKESTYFDYEELKLFEYSLPLIIRNIVLLLSEDKGYSTFKAEEIFYKTQTYELLQDIETGLYEEDPYFIYETMLQDEMKYGYIIQREF